jgi:hypothetical protein
LRLPPVEKQLDIQGQPDLPDKVFQLRTQKEAPFGIQLFCKIFVFFETFLKVVYGQHYFDILSQLAGERRVRSGDSPIKAPPQGLGCGR